VTVSGTVERPEWTGTASADDVLLRLDGDVPAFSSGRVRVDLAPGLVRVLECSAQLGYAPVGATGSVTLPTEGAPVLDLSVHGRNALIVRSPELRLRSDVDATVRGTPDALQIAGEARITDALYSRAIGLFGRGDGSPDRALQLFSIRSGLLSTARFDLRVRADESLRIETELFAGTASAEIELRGTGRIPLPEGRVDTRSMRVNLPFSRLSVTRGSLVFAPENPFEPRIDALAETRMQGHDLDVAVTGTVFSSSVHVSANPALSQEDAIVLLTTGVRPEETGADRIGAAAVGKAGSLLGGALLSWISGPADHESNSFFERMSVEFGKEQSRSGAATIDAEFHVDGNWYLHAQRDHFDDVNFGLLWRTRFR
jgi:autotransporter translocation and assembly factor TamB